MMSMLRQTVMSVLFDVRFLLRAAAPFIVGAAVLCLLTTVPMMGTLVTLGALATGSPEEMLPTRTFVHTAPEHRDEVMRGMTPLLAESLVFDGDPADFDAEVDASSGIRGSVWLVRRDDTPIRSGDIAVKRLLANARAVSAGVTRSEDVLSPADFFGAFRASFSGLGETVALVVFGLTLVAAQSVGISLGSHRFRGINQVLRMYSPPMVFFVADSMVSFLVLFGMTLGVLLFVVPGAGVAMMLLVGTGLLSIGAMIGWATGCLAMAVCATGPGLLLGTLMGCWSFDHVNNPAPSWSMPIAAVVVGPACFVLPWDGGAALLPVLGAPMAFMGQGTVAWVGCGVQVLTCVVCLLLGGRIYAGNEALGELLWRWLGWSHSGSIDLSTSDVRGGGSGGRLGLLLRFHFHQVQWRARLFGLAFPLGMAVVVSLPMAVNFDSFATAEWWCRRRRQTRPSSATMRSCRS